MPRSDYAHWNEDADHMWWMEEGRFAGQEDPPDPDDDYDPYEDWDEYDDQDEL